LGAALRNLLSPWMDVVLDRPDPREGLAQLVAIQPQACILFVESDRPQSVQFARRVRHDSPETNLVIVARTDDGTVTREAMRLGARALAILPGDEHELEQVFETMSFESYETSDDGMVVALLGAKGGMGTTSVAINLAGVLASERSNRVALVDLALYIGEVAVYLDMKTPYALGELVRDLKRLDDAWIEQNVPRHRAGFYVLSQPAEWDDVDAIKVADVIQSIALLKRYFTHVVLDAGAQLSEVALAGVTVADHCIVVCTQELPSLVSTRRRVAMLTQIAGSQKSIRVVANRWQDDGAYDRQSIETYVQHGLNATIRNDYRNMSACIESGKLLVEQCPDAEICGDIRNVARLFDESVAAKDKARRKLFGLF
jgi:pilus assembly protein CpaE